MLSVGKLSGGNLGYYLRLAREDYFLESGEPEGYYLGEGAKRFGLQGKVGASVLHHLFEGRAPDGVTSLRQIQRGSKKHLPRPGFDLTFSAPSGLLEMQPLGPVSRPLITRPSPRVSNFSSGTLPTPG